MFEANKRVCKLMYAEIMPVVHWKIWWCQTFFFFLLFLGKLWRLVWSCVKLAVMSSPVSCSQGTHQCHMIDFGILCDDTVLRVCEDWLILEFHGIKLLPKHTYLFKKVWRQNLIDFGVSWDNTRLRGCKDTEWKNFFLQSTPRTTSHSQS